MAMKTNKYRTLVSLIKDNNLKIIRSREYDPQNGFHYVHYNVYDGDIFIFDMSINGCCFCDSSVDKTIGKINCYLTEKSMTTFDDFETWVESYAVDDV